MTDEQETDLPAQDQPEASPPQEQLEAPHSQEQPQPIPAQGQPQLTLAQELAELVRERTRAEAKLTPLGRVEGEDGLLTMERQEELVAEMQADEACQDIQPLRSSEGAIFLYSSLHMTDSYANILFRVEEGNPYEQIAAPVRENSRVFPRPTALKEFDSPVYGVDPERTAKLVEEMFQLEQYCDIKKVVAQTGAVYLYSDRFLDRTLAEAKAHWVEVEQYESL